MARLTIRFDDGDRLVVRFGDARRSIVYSASASDLARLLGAQLSALSGLSGALLQEHLLRFAAGVSLDLAGNLSVGEVLAGASLDAHGSLIVDAIQAHELAGLVSAAGALQPGLAQAHSVALSLGAALDVAGDLDIGGGGVADEHFRVSLASYTGTGAAQAITGIGFKPDMMFIVERDASTTNVVVFDEASGAITMWDVTKTASFGDDVVDGTGAVSSFDADGFTLGSDALVNGSGANYLAICFKAGSGAQTPNLSLVHYTADGTEPRTLSHGVGTVPIWVWNNAWPLAPEEWLADFPVDQTSPLGGALEFNDDGYMGGTATEFMLGNDFGWNFGPIAATAYLFGGDVVAGKFATGTYAGTGTSGNAVTGLGFQPSVVMIRSASGPGLYLLADGLSPATTLRMTDGQRSGGFSLDADGFTLNGTADENTSGTAYRYLAWI